MMVASAEKAKKLIEEEKARRKKKWEEQETSLKPPNLTQKSSADVPTANKDDKDSPGEQSAAEEANRVNKTPVCGDQREVDSNSGIRDRDVQDEVKHETFNKASDGNTGKYMQWLVFCECSASQQPRQ